MRFPEGLGPLCLARISLLFERLVTLGAAESKCLQDISALSTHNTRKETPNQYTSKLHAQKVIRIDLAVVPDEHDSVSRVYWRRAEVATLYSYHITRQTSSTRVG